jgi:hypothetical protein
MLSPTIPGKKWRASIRLRTEATWSKTLVKCSSLSTDHSLRFRAGGAGEGGQLARLLDELLDGAQDEAHHAEAGREGQDADADDQPEDPGGRVGLVFNPVLGQAIGEQRREDAEPREDEGDDEVEADVKSKLFHLQNGASGRDPALRGLL